MSKITKFIPLQHAFNLLTLIEEKMEIHPTKLDFNCGVFKLPESSQGDEGFYIEIDDHHGNVTPAVTLAGDYSGNWLVTLGKDTDFDSGDRKANDRTASLSFPQNKIDHVADQVISWLTTSTIPQ